MKRLSDLQPSKVWKYFEEVCSIPRPSGFEERIADYLVEFARSRGLDYMRDDADNVLIRKSWSGEGGGSRPPLALQAHVDMVPEKREGVEHDFLRDPIIPVIDGDWVTAPDTTLGADNGMGVAVMLAILDSRDLAHPFLECIFTTDEERGLTGAAALDPGRITAKRMINLDSEDLGEFIIGCAGGMDVVLRSRVGFRGEGPCGMLRVSGLRGGHSGMEIGSNRANAVRLAARALDGLLALGCSLAGIDGGGKRNAIPRDARARVMIPEGVEKEAIRFLEELETRLKEEYEGIEDSIGIGMEDDVEQARLMEPGEARRIVDLLLGLPHGVEKMSGTIEGLVETSDNLAIVTTDGDTVEIHLSVRSPFESAREALARRVAAVGRLGGCDISSGNSYPGWIPNVDSPLLRRMKIIYERTFGTPPEVKSIHAGLECGLIGNIVGGLDMISVGPDIRDVHVPGEKVRISSVREFWRFIVRVLSDLDGDFPE